MRSGALLSLTLFVLPASAVAEPNTPLDENQALGQRLFTQSCTVCHLKPQITAGLYGPPLSKDAAGGREDVMRDVISNGTPRMPGFKYQFEPAQIAAIVSYLKTVPAPPTAR